MAGIGDTAEAITGHFEHAEIVGGAETMLHRANQSEGVVTLALEGDHGVDEMLEHPRPGEIAFLGDVSDEHDREITPFRLGHESLRDRSDLGDRASGRRE